MYLICAKDDGIIIPVLLLHLPSKLGGFVLVSCSWNRVIISSGHSHYIDKNHCLCDIVNLKLSLEFPLEI